MLSVGSWHLAPCNADNSTATPGIKGGGAGGQRRDRLTGHVWRPIRSSASIRHITFVRQGLQIG
jgi:hypothetical protein